VRGAGSKRFGHRRQREAVSGVAVFRQHAGRSDHCGSDGRDRPVGQDIQDSHGYLWAM